MKTIFKNGGEKCSSDQFQANRMNLRVKLSRVKFTFETQSFFLGMNFELFSRVKFRSHFNGVEFYFGHHIWWEWE